MIVLTKREKASLNSETCSSVRVSACDMLAFSKSYFFVDLSFASPSAATRGVVAAKSSGEGERASSRGTAKEGNVWTDHSCGGLAVVRSRLARWVWNGIATVEVGEFVDN